MILAENVAEDKWAHCLTREVHETGSLPQLGKVLEAGGEATCLFPQGWRERGDTDGGSGVWSCLLTSAPSSRRARTREGSRSPAVGRPGRKIRLGEDGESSEDVSTRPIGVVEDERTQGVDGRIDSGLRP